MGAMASQITRLAIVYSTVYSGTDQRKHQSSASLGFVQGIYRWPVNSLHKWPVKRKMFPIWWRRPCIPWPHEQLIRLQESNRLFLSCVFLFFASFLFLCMNNQEPTQLNINTCTDVKTDHSDVVGAPPVGAAPTASSFLIQHLASMDWAKTTTRRNEKHLVFVIWCDIY